MAIYEIKKLAYIILYQLLSAKITVFLGVNSVVTFQRRTLTIFVRHLRVDTLKFSPRENPSGHIGAFGKLVEIGADQSTALLFNCRI